MTVPWVPTGMKIGVSTVPCGKTKLPQRAEVVGSVAVIVKDTEEPGEIVQKPTRAKLNHAVPQSVSISVLNHRWIR